MFQVLVHVVVFYLVEFRFEAFNFLDKRLYLLLRLVMPVTVLLLNMGHMLLLDRLGRLFTLFRKFLLQVILKFLQLLRSRISLV